MLLLSLGLALAMQGSTAPAEIPEPPTEVTKRAYGPPAPAKARRKPAPPAAASTDKRCADAEQRIADKSTILVCGSPSEAYRLDPDLMRAEERRRIARRSPPRRPAGAMPDTGICERSGGCRASEAINWVGVAMVVGQMAAKAAKGENVGQMFVTNPSPSEYELYQQAKVQREANELDAAASAAAARARAAKAEKAADAATPPAPEQ